MTAARPVPAPDIHAVAGRILPAGTPAASPGLTPARHEDSEHARLDLLAVITAARDARHFTTARMKQWEVPAGTIQAAQTIVSELVTNSYQAANSGTEQISVTLSRLPGQIVIEVSDNDSRLPAMSDPADDAESGRGLHMIAALSDEWGCHPRHSGGKVVYAIMRIPRDQPPRPAQANARPIPANACTDPGPAPPPP
jgi:anti-sigma regulatory factor (Ser/Thr protein kinase)